AVPVSMVFTPGPLMHPAVHGGLCCFPASSSHVTVTTASDNWPTGPWDVCTINPDGHLPESSGTGTARWFALGCGSWSNQRGVSIVAISQLTMNTSRSTVMTTRRTDMFGEPATHKRKALKRGSCMAT
ncbi:MAG TPA: hypothetical protein VF221_21415, partial [Chloroflexota bacterium]